MRFWNIGAEGQVLIGCLATTACMICLADKLPNAVLILVSLAAALAAAGTFVEARCFLRAYREAVPCIFFVMFGLFSLSVMFGLEPDISLTDSPVKPGNDEKEKKRGMTIRRGEPAMTGGRESTNTAGEKTSPGCVKEAERSARRRGCLV